MKTHWLVLLSPSCSLLGGSNTRTRSSITASGFLFPSKSASRQTLTERSAVSVRQGPFHPDLLAEHWGDRPLLVRHAFHVNDPVFPTSNDLVELACDDEDGSSARLIQHVPGKLESFDLELGPFDPDDLADACRQGSKKKWTLILNDVDRYRPDLSYWMDQHFQFLPRWRRDDAQISTATIGGGIGPHVDNYDVFLIQTAGSRTWSISTTKLSVSEEMENLIPDISVRILDLPEEEREEMLLEAGDLLYLPPRILHCGTAKSNDCTTLSVGCRAPSAAELLARVAEALQNDNSVQASQRFTESFDRLYIQANQPSITKANKKDMKSLVLQAVESLLENEDAWDQLVGGITTEATRYVEFPVTPYDFRAQDDEAYAMEWGLTAKNAIQRVMENSSESLGLIREAGVCFATSTVSVEEKNVLRLFANGEVWQVDAENSSSVSILYRIERGIPLQRHDLEHMPSDMQSVVQELVDQGYLIATSL